MQALYNLDQLLLQRLGDAKGDLLENAELISLLGGTLPRTHTALAVAPSRPCAVVSVWSRCRHEA